MANPKSQITTLDDDTTVAAPVEAKQIVKPRAIEGTSGDMSMLTIYSSNDELGNDPVECGLNGYAFVIKRDIPVLVPVELVEVFKNAIQTTFSNGIPSNRPRYAFSATPV